MMATHNILLGSKQFLDLDNELNFGGLKTALSFWVIRQEIPGLTFFWYDMAHPEYFYPVIIFKLFLFF
jgi:hypothetical protein